MTHCHTLIEDLRQKGYRLTPQREMIVNIIAHSESHMSADHIYHQVQERTEAVNIATVYRTLDMLVSEGLVCRTDLGGGKIVYATREHGPHMHLVCKSCHSVIDANHAPLTLLGQELSKKYKFQADLQHISIFGLCQKCQERKVNR
ncbi:MAG: Fur family transcriptional regulator [Chloroflexota bacterium]